MGHYWDMRVITDWSCHVQDAHGGMVPAQLKMRHETNTLTGTSEGSELWVRAVARVLRGDLSRARPLRCRLRHTSRCVMSSRDTRAAAVGPAQSTAPQQHHNIAPARPGRVTAAQFLRRDPKPRAPSLNTGVWYVETQVSSQGILNFNDDNNFTLRGPRKVSILQIMQHCCCRAWCTIALINISLIVRKN